MGYPHGHRKTTTLVAGLRMTGLIAPMVLDGSINGDWFEAYVGQLLIPELKPGDVVVMDDLFSQRRASLSALIEPAGARLLFLPPLQPRLQPDRKGLARLKAMLRKAGERTVSGLWSLNGNLVDLFQTQECANYFSSCGYDLDQGKRSSCVAVQLLAEMLINERPELGKRKEGLNGLKVGLCSYLISSDPEVLHLHFVVLTRSLSHQGITNYRLPHPLLAH